VAPMLDWTDRHERFFLRLLSKNALLYTEMITSGALIHGDTGRHLRFNEEEHPVAVQLGGSDPHDLARSAQMAELAGYDEINLNVGCPSDRVQSGKFGACLMKEPLLVADCVRAIKSSVETPVTIKCRAGIDNFDSDEFLEEFILTVAGAGCTTFIIHARIALLKGLSPKDNREIPPLNYERVLRIKRNHPQLKIIINGGINSLSQGLAFLEHLDGVMLGREAYQNPWILHAVDELFFSQEPSSHTRFSILQSFIPYVAEQIQKGVPLQHMTRHILGLFHACPGGKAFRRHLSENAYRKNASITVLEDAIALVLARRD
jgi:tRNA-dihydrouridine synthase A